MLRLSANRADIAEKWNREVAGGGFSVSVEAEVPTEKRVPAFTFYNVALSVFLSIAQIFVIKVFVDSLTGGNNMLTLAFLTVFLIFSVVLHMIIKRIVLHFNPARSIKVLGTAVYATLCECGLISPAAKVETKAYKNLAYITMQLRNASVHDQNVFNTAMAEMLSPIENPRYILIEKNIFGGYNYLCSFACPSVIAKKREYVDALAKNLKIIAGRLRGVRTQRERTKTYSQMQKKVLHQHKPKNVGKKIQGFSLGIKHRQFCKSSRNFICNIFSGACPAHVGFSISTMSENCYHAQAAKRCGMRFTPKPKWKTYGGE